MTVRKVLSATTSQEYSPVLWKLTSRNHKDFPSERFSSMKKFSKGNILIGGVSSLTNLNI